MISIEQLNGEITALNEQMPTYAIMQRLADLYVVRDHIGIGTGSKAEEEIAVPHFSDSEFAQSIEGKEEKEVWPILDEMMATLHVLNSRLYDSVIRKLAG